jgi:Sulfotransferase domain
MAEAGAAPEPEPVRLAMWSGPRNISTALMRAWENRDDSLVVDEPLYAYYLAVTGLDHPGREAVIATGETDWRRVVAGLLGPVAPGVRVYYQKHMTHHLVGDLDHDWIGRLHNVMLIRDPREVVASYVRSRANVTADDIGLRQQLRLYDELAASGDVPLVIDSTDFLRDPETYLRGLCGRVGLPFEPGMLSWPPGRRDSDGVWAPYWYAAVEASTGFEPYRPREVRLSGRAAEVAAECLPMFQRLHALRWLPGLHTP